jgi:hypothetical protein
MGRVRRWLSACGLAAVVGLAVVAMAQGRIDLDAPEVVLRQLAAFRAGDYRAAYAFASPEIQARFDLEAFEKMVKAGYPQIARSVDAWVAEVRSAPDAKLYVLVKIRGADGILVEALYEMVWDELGWRINGVVTRPAVLAL